MIEFCNKRRMILSIVILGLLTVLVLILEEVLTEGIGIHEGWVWVQNTTTRDSIKAPVIDANPSRSNVQESLPEEKKRVCWLYEEFAVIQECSFCTDFELSSKTSAVCAVTGMKESIRCVSSGTVFRSCSRVIGLQKRRFWIFQSLMLFSVVLSYGIVKIRWSQLERKTVRAIERRLTAGH